MNLPTFIQETEREFDEKFKCINSDCDGKGNIPHQIAEDEWEAQQCQYCFEVRFSAKAFLRSRLLALVEEMRKCVPPEKRRLPHPGPNSIFLHSWLKADQMITAFNDCRAQTLVNLDRFSAPETLTDKDN